MCIQLYFPFEHTKLARPLLAHSLNLFPTHFNQITLSSKPAGAKEPPTTAINGQSMVKNEAYGTADSAQLIKIHGNDAYQTAAEAIATEQNEAYGGRVEGIDHTLTTTVEYEEVSSPDYEYDYIRHVQC